MLHFSMSVVIYFDTVEHCIIAAVWIRAIGSATGPRSELSGMLYCQNWAAGVIMHSAPQDIMLAMPLAYNKKNRHNRKGIPGFEPGTC